MDGLSPIDALLTGRLRDEDFLSAVDRVIADGSAADRTILIEDWRTKSGRIRRPDMRRQLDEKVRRLAWATGDTLIRGGNDPQGDASPVRIGDILAHRFVIEAELGTGGMGTVFRALDLRRQEALDRNPYVAIKTLSADVLRRADSLQILQREARKAQGLSHPNIVRIYDFDRDGSILFLTMELLVGVSLEAMIRDNGPGGAPLSRMLPILEQVAAALQFAHDEGIVHSDLKPGNIIILPNGRVKVIDFGIARAIPKANEETADRTTFDVSALGALTPAYASPEMIEGSAPDARDDVFALACIAYECVTGRHPFGRTPASVARAGNFVPVKPPGLPPLQWQALLNALRFDRALRTPRPAQFLAELTAQEPPSSFRRKGLVFAGLAGIVLVGAAIGAVLDYHDLSTGIKARLGLGGEATQPAPAPPGGTGVRASDDAAAKAQAAARQAQQKAAADAAAQQAQQKAAEEAAAQQAQEKAAADAAAQQAQQKAAEEAAARQAQEKAATDAAAQQAQQKAAEDTAARQAQEKAAADAAAQQAQQKAAEVAAPPIPSPVSQVGPSQIAEAQRLLTSMGFDTGGADGKAGPRTREMVLAFQSAAGEPPTGEVTMALLTSLQQPAPPAAARARSLFAEANDARRSHRADDAIMLYETGLKLAPRDADGLLALGDLRRDTADDDAARRAYQAAERGGGPAAEAAHQRLAALSAPASTVQGGNKVTPAQPSAPVVASVQPGAGTVLAPPGPHGDRPFDGTYLGSSKVVGLSSPNCHPDDNAKMTISDNMLSFLFVSGTKPMTSRVAADGTFNNPGMNILTTPGWLLWQSLTGKVMGDSIEANIDSVRCKFHLSLKKN